MRSHHIVHLALATLLSASLGACASQPTDGSDTAAAPEATEPVTEPLDATDESESTGPLQNVSARSRVVALSHEMANMWLLAGGQVVGVVDEAAGIEGLSSSVEFLGSPMDINPKRVVALAPDLVIADSYDEITPQLLHTIDREGAPLFLAHVDSFETYAEVMGQLTEATGREDLYEKNVTAVGERVDEVVAHVQAEKGDTYVVLRIEGQSVRGTESGDWLDATLGDLGLKAQSVPTGDLAAKDLAGANPKWIFVVYGGDGAKAQETFAALQEQEGWADLEAAKKDRVVVLPQQLFEHMPANRWAEAYAYFSQVLSGSWA